MQTGTKLHRSREFIAAARAGALQVRASAWLGQKVRHEKPPAAAR
jgi:hypothetical protein